MSGERITREAIERRLMLPGGVAWVVDVAKAARAVAEALEGVSTFARSGWRKEGGRFYCLVCDEDLCLTPGATKGKRAATFEEITHDPDCPVPDAEAALARFWASVER